MVCISWVRIMGILIIMMILASGGMRRIRATLVAMEIWTGMRTIMMGLKIMDHLVCFLEVEDMVRMVGSGGMAGVDSIEGGLEDLV